MEHLQDLYYLHYINDICSSIFILYTTQYLYCSIYSIYTAVGSAAKYNTAAAAQR